MRDPIEEDEYGRNRREAEEERELEWNAFIILVQNFAESQGWPAVMTAVGRALDEHLKSSGVE